jgi:carboxypeptidase Taq
MGYAAFLDRMGQVNDLLNAKSILSWDANTMMPPCGAATRAKQMATLMGLARDVLVSDETRSLLDKAESEVFSTPADSVERTICAQTRDAIDYHLRIPSDLIRKRTELGGLGHDIWADARKNDDFAAFAPLLEETVALNREMAEHIGYETHPYDALMYRFEPGETMATLKTLFATLREGLLPLLRKVQGADTPRIDFLERAYPAEQQLAVGLT